MKALLKKKSDSSFPVTINYIGGVLSLEQEKGTSGKELFSTVCTTLGVTEFWYFGIQYQTKRGQLYWVRPNTKVYHLIRKTDALLFRVKYFPEEIGRVKDETTLTFVYKQCQDNVVSGIVFCPPETSILLGSYALQAEVGDWPCVDHYTLNLPKYLPPAVLEQYAFSKRSLCDSLKSWHKDHGGLNPDEAKLEYVRVTQYLSMYGVNYFPAKHQGATIWVGINPKGISIYRDNLLVPFLTLKWLFIRLVLYSCRKFIVKTLLTQTEEYSFQMKNLRATRTVFEFAVGYHHLYLRTRSVDTIEVSQKDTDTEKFRETTEETCQNDITRQIVKKHSKRTVKRELPVVNEEEESLIC